MEDDKTAKEREAEIESDLMPLDYMLRRMRDPGMGEPEPLRGSAPCLGQSNRTHGHRNDRAGRSNEGDA
jgi:hypothetical protein